MFSDNEKAAAELECHAHLLILSTIYYDQGKYKEAAEYLMDAAKSLKELQRLKEEKQHGQVRLVGYVLGSRNDVDRRI